MFLPDFLYVGTAKAGSTWIYEILKEHPDVFVPIAKDIMFFSKEYHRGIEWYKEFFKKTENYCIKGEICHDYYLKAEFAKRINSHLPNVKLIFCLRDPIDWLPSISNFMIAARDSAQDYLKFLEEETYLKGIVWGDYLKYHEKLLPFYEMFPKDQILVLFYDELKANPIDFAKRIYNFIGVSDDFIPSVIYKKVNVSPTPRIRWIAHFVYSCAGIARRMGFQNLVGFLKHNSLIDKFLYHRQRGQKKKLDRDLVRKMVDRYSKKYEKLEHLIGRTLPTSWHKDK